MPEKRTERSGVGQSGYTSGRVDDPALRRQIQTHGELAPDDTPPDNQDDRWRGRGGPLQPPEKPEAA
jgi:hypothetical protein